MDDGDTEPGPLVQVKDVQPGTADFEQVLALAAQVLAQDRYQATWRPSGLIRGYAAAASEPRSSSTQRGSAGSPAATSYDPAAR